MRFAGWALWVVMAGCTGVVSQPDAGPGPDGGTTLGCARDEDCDAGLACRQTNDFLGVTDSAERLFVDFASSDRIKQAAEAKTGTAWGEAFAAARA